MAKERIFSSFDFGGGTDDFKQLDELVREAPASKIQLPWEKYGWLQGSGKRTIFGLD